MEEIFKVGLLVFLGCIVSTYTGPVDVEIIDPPEKAVLKLDLNVDDGLITVDLDLGKNYAETADRGSRQENGGPGGAAGGGDVDGGEDGGDANPANNNPLSQEQLSGIGKNVVGVVTSALSGNVGGIVNGGLTLLNTRNRVNDLLAGLGVTDKNPNATLNANATTSTLATTTVDEDEDDDEDYPFAESPDLTKARKGKMFYWF